MTVITGIDHFFFELQYQTKACTVYQESVTGKNLANEQHYAKLKSAKCFDLIQICLANNKLPYFSLVKIMSW